MAINLIWEPNFGPFDQNLGRQSFLYEFQFYW